MVMEVAVDTIQMVTEMAVDTIQMDMAAMDTTQMDTTQMVTIQMVMEAMDTATLMVTDQTLDTPTPTEILTLDTAKTDRPVALATEQVDSETSTTASLTACLAVLATTSQPTV